MALRSTKLTERQRQFFLRFADLCEEFNVDISYTSYDDGIHIAVDGEEVYVGWDCDANGFRQLAAGP